ncbi:M48 family metallopeptidase [Pusillimonas sp. CC-YST705]|uniref:M48 family metallopeptidase n=1 Tax=Mesopusillimonas faecipullorum TaxID=2755040 RepID=A0ABS8CAD3_9BURK|nr:M48 family metallopeptidase [Mesopusillimonas faecipullorum]MCB5362997.1 M48 family metallopeptidase [Mesopusillimonas faecipullorum]
MHTTSTVNKAAAKQGWRTKTAALAVCAGLIGVTGCAPMNTTQSGAVGINRTQYMSSMVPEQQLQAEAASQYNQLVQQAKAQKALNPSAAQTKRVRGISQNLIKQVGVFRPDAAAWNWEVNVLDSDEVNAWCMPGGKIAVYTGLIEQLKATDDELAAVIGHEIAHALREHARERVSQQMATGIGLSILAAVTGSNATADLGGQLSQVMFTLPNSRTHETEADRMGVELAARAGYDPRAAVTLWRKMASAGGGGQPEFLSTHPSPTTRIADLEKISEQMMPLYQQAGGKR